MTATDRTHEPDETFRTVLDRIEGADEAHPDDSELMRVELSGEPFMRGAEEWPDFHSRIAHKCSLLGDPFRAEGEPGVDG